MRFIIILVLTLILVPSLFIIPQKSFAFEFSFTFPTLRFIKPTIPPKPALTPTPSPSLTPSPTIKPTLSPSPTIKPTRIPTPRPSSTIISSYSAKKDYIMNAINDYRTSQGVTKVSTDPYTCDFAKIRAKEISINFNHDGFRQRIDSNSLPYPSYKKVVENISLNSNYQNVVKNWINSASHAQNLRADTKYGCVEFAGNYFVYLGWQP